MERVPVHGTHRLSAQPIPFGVLDVYAEADPTGAQPEWLVGIVVPLDPEHIDELQHRLSHGPVMIDCPWNWWDDDSPDEWVRIELFDDESPADLHVPPGRLTIDADGTVVLVE